MEIQVKFAIVQNRITERGLFATEFVVFYHICICYNDN